MRNPAAGKLPPLLFLTDPARTPDPLRVAARLPAGAGVIFRGFGHPEAAEVARALARLCGERKLVLLVGQDEALAAAVGAAGLHLPQRLLAQAPHIRRRRPDWLLTGAAHDVAALDVADEAGLDAVLVSPVFPSDSPSAGEALGVARFTTLVSRSPVPVYALGGVDERAAPELRDSGACGLAAVSGLLQI